MNIPPEAGRFWFTLAVGIVILTLPLMFFIEPGTAAYYINGLSLFCGVLLLALVVILVRKSNR